MTHDADSLILALVVENAELRTHLAEVQEQCVELAVDAGDLHARVEELQAALAQARAERDAWKAEAENGTAPAARFA